MAAGLGQRKVLRERVRFGEIVARAEGAARPGQDDRADVGSFGQHARRCGELTLQLRRQRIAFVRPVQAHNQRATAGLLDGYDGIGHVCSPGRGQF